MVTRQVRRRRPQLLRPGSARRRAAARMAGAGLLAATGGIHLDLYVTGYRSIPVIGWLFLLQLIAAFCLGALVAAVGSRLVAAAGAVFALATLGGYLLSVRFGLFGFREVRTTAGIVAGVVEVAAFAVLAVLAAEPGPARRGTRARGLLGAALARLEAGIPRAAAAAGGVSAIALVLLGLAVAGAAGSSVAGAAGSSVAGPSGAGRPGAASSGQELRTARIGGATVLANSKGFTLYWFAADSPGRSNCTGTCAQYWPPVTGTASAGPGVTGTLGTAARPGGSRQVTYEGHPLYTYIGDSAPGQARGNGLDLNGGRWHEVTVSG